MRGIDEIMRVIRLEVRINPLHLLYLTDFIIITVIKVIGVIEVTMGRFKMDLRFIKHFEGIKRVRMDLII